jgi:hypothetical protein
VVHHNFAAHSFLLVERDIPHPLLAGFHLGKKKEEGTEMETERLRARGRRIPPEDEDT